MADIAHVVEAKISFAASYALRAHESGFTLSGGRDPAERRVWPLPDGGFVSSTEDNEVVEVRVRSAAAGVIELPPPDLMVDTGGPLEARLAWPTQAHAWMSEESASRRYELRLLEDAVAVWRRLNGCEAYVGLTADGQLARVSVEAPREPIRRRPLIVSDVRYDAILQDGRILVVERKADLWPPDDGGGEDADVPAENAWMTTAADGRLVSLEVYDTAASDPEPVEPSASSASEARGWIGSPTTVHAASTRGDVGLQVTVRFSPEPPDRWVSLQASRILVGLGTDGAVCRIAFCDVEEPPPGWLHDDLEDADEPFSLPHLSRVVDLAPTFRFQPYSLAGALAVHVGLGSGRGVPDSLELGFGERESEPALTVTASRETDETLMRLNLLAELQPEESPPADASLEAMRDFFDEQHRRHRDAERALIDAPWPAVQITVEGQAVPFASMASVDRWVAYARIDDTLVGLAARDWPPDAVVLERVGDLAPHVEHARTTARQEMERRLTEEGRRRLAERAAIPPEERERRTAARRVVSDVLRAIHRQAPAPRFADMFTQRIAEEWGGPDRYQQLLWLHTMLRPIVGHSSGGDWPKLDEDGSARMRISLRHRPIEPDDQDNSLHLVVLSSHGGREEPEHVPDRSAILRGEAHDVTLRIVREDDRWKIDTDLLAILIERLGDVDTLARPQSELNNPG